MRWSKCARVIFLTHGISAGKAGDYREHATHYLGGWLSKRQNFSLMRRYANEASMAPKSPNSEVLIANWYKLRIFSCL